MSFEEGDLVDQSEFTLIVVVLLPALLSWYAPPLVLLLCGILLVWSGVVTGIATANPMQLLVVGLGTTMMCAAPVVWRLIRFLESRHSDDRKNDRQAGRAAQIRPHPETERDLSRRYEALQPVKPVPGLDRQPKWPD
ncbi:hypothetical protein [Aurantimonas sp. VKM B-3413]|uniref:hypothetical protein n=1 Tax=Aurantimonas sp. VKM B-3413 TaxID=2779401 RepID=UPI001E56C732|nr:hypothetical protein [Aurantimonas sp. VKM B-3413]MCB8835925.1 hypothetical protein [Aurantimonas sp. VKM B-3413]